VLAGEDDKETIHLVLGLPRGLSQAKLTGLITELEQVRAFRLD